MLTLHLFVASLPISNHPTYFETMESGVVDLTVSTCVTTSHMSEREPTHAKKQSTLNQQRLIENHVFGDAQSFSDAALLVADIAGSVSFLRWGLPVCTGIVCSRV